MLMYWEYRPLGLYCWYAGGGTRSRNVWMRRHYSLPLDGGGRGGGDLHPLLRSIRTWPFIWKCIVIPAEAGIRAFIPGFRIKSGMTCGIFILRCALPGRGR